ncbi:MAG: GNAT family N-acetyltransferase, partial [Planctomycetaceae bacterium]|nr:GNAT family N-acetyltransferase [Planctomycetaceae bacterium]
PAATMVTAMRHIHASRRDWDLIDLRYIDQDGHDHRRTMNSFKSVGFQSNLSVWQKLPLINTSETNWEDFLASRTDKTQHKISSAEQLARKQGPVAFYRSRLEDPLAPGWNPRWDLWAEFQRMNFRDGNQLNIAGGDFSQDKKLSFLHDIHGPAVRAGMARIDALFVNHSLVACAYGLQHGSGTDYLAAGRRNDAPREVITTLIARMVQQSIQDGEPALNLGLLGNSLTEMWNNQEQVSYRCSHFPILAPRSQLLRMNRWIQKADPQPVGKKKSKAVSGTSNSATSESLQSSKPDSCIEITDDAPQDWSLNQERRGVSTEDRPRFRIVG